MLPDQISKKCGIILYRILRLLASTSVSYSRIRFLGPKRANFKKMELVEIHLLVAIGVAILVLKFSLEIDRDKDILGSLNGL